MLAACKTTMVSPFFRSFELKPMYHALEWMLPLRWRLALRRARAGSGRSAHFQDGLENELMGKAPDGWPGWPDGREFAVVLSHEVAGSKGLDRCRRLAEMEMELGFRSAFYFPVNGVDPVPVELLEWLRGNGFEIGVFLKPVRSGASLEAEAQAINGRLAEWGATGVRGEAGRFPLDGLHALKIDHDGSTEDTNPLQPQRGGVQTVFPFWVPRPDPEADALRRSGPNDSAGGGDLGNNGFLELPNTLARPDDLFVIRRERDIGNWKTKLRWLAGRRAMATLASRPDDMAWPGRAAGADEYPVQRYREFLEHVRSEYTGRFWPALPRQVAGFCRTFRPRQARPPRQVVMVSYSYYKSDNRVRRYAETLARRGDRVQALCIGNEEQLRDQRCETLNGVQIVRLVERPDKGAAGWLQAWRLGCFFWQALIHLGRPQPGGGWDLLHVHNVPDFLVFTGAMLKRRGTRIILDIHDILPELYESKFGAKRRSWPVALLRWMEKWSCGFADHVIIANHIWKKVIVKRSAPADKVTALVNNVDLELFSPRARTRSDDRFILIYPGTLNRHQGLDLAIDAVKRLVPGLPQIELHIYGGGSAKQELQQQVEQLKLTNHVRFFPGVFLDQVPDLIANADVGIVPKRAEGFGDQAYSTKIMEFMSQGLPVVLSRTTIDSLYFDDSVVAFFESGNADDLARAIRRVVADEPYRRELSRAGLAYARANSWATMQDVYLNVVDRLTRTGISQPPASEPV